MIDQWDNWDGGDIGRKGTKHLMIIVGDAKALRKVGKAFAEAHLTQML